MPDTRESMLPSPSSSSSPENIAERPPRRKRWAPKVKTGCVTCRARRVKCDETKPHCKRCIGYGYSCDGYIVPPHPTHAAAAAPAAAQQSQKQLTRQPQTPLTPPSVDYDHNRTVLQKGIDPPDWEFSESCRFYLSDVKPMRERNIGRGEAASFSLGNRDRSGFLLSMIAMQISFRAASTGTLPDASQMTASGPAWSKLHTHMLENIQSINTHIHQNNSLSRATALFRITDLLGVELSLLGTPWRAHNSGFLALLRLRDEVTYSLPPSGCLDSTIQFNFITAVMANSTSPAHDQIEELYQFSADEVAKFFSVHVYSEMPCPTTLFLELFCIVKLRRLSVTGAPYHAAIRPVLDGILERVSAFVPEMWHEPYGVPKQPEFVVMARVFKVAVALYGVLTLPPPSASSAPEDVSSWEMRRIYLRTELLRLMREAAGLLVDKGALCWPAAVAAVAIADGSQADQEFVISIVGPKKEGQGQSFYVPAFYKIKFRQFWASGKLGWDECYNEPFAPMA